ncbi:MAG: ATP synthase F1 subunit delta [Clostridiales bacterium]|nr:ATP synthase F1 subunit delta [Clostridiales bacterium]
MTGRGREYASALFDVAMGDGCLDEIFEGMKVIKEIFDSSEETVELLLSPAIPKEERTGIVERCFGGQVHEDLVAFLCVLTRKGHVRDFNECYEVFDELYKESSKRSKAVVISAVELDDQTKARLVEKLHQMSGHIIEAEYRIDKSLIGGLIVEMDGRRIDGSLKKRLKEIKEVMQ